MKQIRNFINGEFVATGDWFDKRAPYDGKVIAQVAAAGKREVDDAVRAARAALLGPWGKMSVAARVEMLHAVAAEIERRFDDFVAAEMSDIGQPEHFIRHVDVPRGAANFRIFADVVKNVPSEFFEMATPDGRGALNYSIRRPVGVVGVICPWNLPFLLMTWKVGPALACGNTVVVKPSEETPQTAALLGEVMNAVGVPAGVFNVVHGFGPDAAGEFLTTHPQRRCDHLHRRNPHRRGHHESGGRRRPPGVAGNGRQERGDRVCRLRHGCRHRRHAALGLRQLRPGLPGHRAGVRRAADIR